MLFYLFQNDSRPLIQTEIYAPLGSRTAPSLGVLGQTGSDA